jgi:hypothetical protein
MIVRFALTGALMPFIAHAQIALFAVNGTTLTPTGTVYSYGNVAAGNNTDMRFRVENGGVSSVLLTSLSLSGNSFSIIGAPSFPYTLAPGNFLEFTVRFAPVSVGSFSAALLVNSQSNSLNVLLTATAVSAPILGGLPAVFPGSLRTQPGRFPERAIRQDWRMQFLASKPERAAAGGLLDYDRRNRIPALEPARPAGDHTRWIGHGLCDSDHARVRNHHLLRHVDGGDAGHHPVISARGRRVCSSASQTRFQLESGHARERRTGHSNDDSPVAVPLPCPVFRLREPCLHSSNHPGARRSHDRFFYPAAPGHCLFR